jgi:microcystin-dependent protein
MANPFVGEIRMFGGNFAPAGWAFCNGQLMPISENDTLFQLIGTTYGGDGQETFALPDLQGRVPVHAGQGPGISQNYQLGEKTGTESVTLSVQQIPTHTHALIGSTDNATDPNPTSDVLATNTIMKPYAAEVPDGTLNANAVSPIGGSQPHENMMPYLVVSFIISLFGIYPRPS